MSHSLLARHITASLIVQPYTHRSLLGSVHCVASFHHFARPLLHAAAASSTSSSSSSVTSPASAVGPAPSATPPAPMSPPSSPSSSSPATASVLGSLKVFNVALDARKPLVWALRGVYGVGAHSARLLCGQLGLNPNTPLRSLHASFPAIKQHIEQHYQPRHIAEKAIAARILHKVKIGSYEGIRHTQSLPVRGQRTQTNARTQRKLGRQRMIAFNIPAFNKKKPGSAGSKPQLATLAQQQAQQQQAQQQNQNKQGQKKAG